jgi:hypothetical protein
MTSILRGGNRTTRPGDASPRGVKAAWWRGGAVVAGLLSLAAVVGVVDGIVNVYGTYGSLGGGWAGLFAFLALVPVALAVLAVALWRRAAR